MTSAALHISRKQLIAQNNSQQVVQEYEYYDEEHALPLPNGNGRCKKVATDDDDLSNLVREYINSLDDDNSEKTLLDNRWDVINTNRLTDQISRSKGAKVLLIHNSTIFKRLNRMYDKSKNPPRPF